MNAPEYQQAAEIVRQGGGLLIGAGAGMGVDSGLPDFRGPEGFWKAYPPFHGRKFSDISTPHWFSSDPQLAWGFFGHRLQLYRAAQPHAGFEILQRWGSALAHSYFVFTSNVDGQFQKAGFDPNRIVECHGSIRYLQCATPCCNELWSASDLEIEVDQSNIRAKSKLPECPYCGNIARPNILMFGDHSWIAARTERQYLHYRNWLRQADNRRLVIIEIGAGLTVPSVRRECENRSGKLIRINPREPDVDSPGIGLEATGLAGLQTIDQILANKLSNR